MKKINKLPLYNKITRAVIIATGLVVMASAVLLYVGSRERLVDSDVAVVLGNEVYGNASPSPRLAARLDAALKLYRNGHCKTIIVSGGLGKSGVDEAKAMKDYLRKNGVPADSIVVDSNGVNTWATAVFTARYLREHNLNSVIAVSQALHIPRTVMAFKSAGCPKVGQASPDYWEAKDFYSILREFPALVFYWWKYDRPSDK